MKDLIILGAGGSGEDISSIVEAINKESLAWNIMGYLDDNKDLIGKELCGHKVLGSIDTIIEYPEAYFISAIANPTNRIIRRFIYEKVKSLGGKFATLIHPSAILYDNVIIKEGSIINALCVLGSNCEIQEDVHLAYSCNIAHETIIGKHTSFGTGVNLSSGVIIGDDCYIGAGVSASHDIKIEENTLVSVGAAVVSDLNGNSQRMWIGVPAISIKEYMKNKIKLSNK